MNVLKNKRITIFIGVFTCENLAWYQTRDLPTQWFPNCSVTFHSGSQTPSAPRKGGPFQVASTLRGHLSVIVCKQSRLRSWHTQGMCVKKAFIGNFLFLSFPTPWWIFLMWAHTGPLFCIFVSQGFTKQMTTTRYSQIRHFRILTRSLHLRVLLDNGR